MSNRPKSKKQPESDLAAKVRRAGELHQSYKTELWRQYIGSEHFNWRRLQDLKQAFYEAKKEVAASMASPG